MKQHQENMTKLRFTRKFKRQEYVQTCSMAKVKKIMNLRLNMTELKANFRGKYNDNLCPACGIEEETTEHVISCPEYQELTGHSLNTTNCLEESMNSVKWLEEACEVYERIEETRKWLLWLKKVKSRWKNKRYELNNISRKKIGTLCTVLLTVALGCS